MHRLQWILLILIIAFPLSAVGQDPAYKTIHSLLQQGKYDEAEPLLKKYLKTSRPNPSAYIQLGNLFYSKAMENFVADDEQETVLFLDSASYAYQKGLAVLSEASMRGNEMYYRNFIKGKNREVRFAAVQNELENRIKKINRKINKIARKSDSISRVNVRKNGGYYALVIGVSQYKDGSLNLDRPEKDAKQFKDVILKHYSFDESDVDLLLNPTRHDIMKELTRLRKRLDKNDNLLIFFAGHGYWDEGAQQGYWWPSDAITDDPTNWLSNSDLRDQIRGIKTAHTLLISDACFSGGILKTRGGGGDIRKAPADIILLYKHPSRRAMTSGSMSAVPDQSVFFKNLKIKLESNSEKFISSQNLFNDIRQAVINNSLVLPQDGVILDTGDEGGDFIFIRKEEVKKKKKR